MFPSLFPDLLSWSQLSPLFVRLALGLVLVFWAYKTLRNSTSHGRLKTLALFEGLAGLLLIAGLWAQAGALFIILDLIVRLFGKIRNGAFLTDGVNYYLLLLVMAISIMLTGPGSFLSFDLPL